MRGAHRTCCKSFLLAGCHPILGLHFWSVLSLICVFFPTATTAECIGWLSTEKTLASTPVGCLTQRCPDAIPGCAMTLRNAESHSESVIIPFQSGKVSVRCWCGFCAHQWPTFIFNQETGDFWLRSWGGARVPGLTLKTWSVFMEFAFSLPVS